MKITCCYECQKRHSNCHSSCQDYIKQKAASQARYASEMQEKHKKKVLNEVQYGSLIKAREQATKKGNKYGKNKKGSCK